MQTVVFLVVIGTTIWVGIDASGKDFSRSSLARSTAIWVLGCVAMWILVFPLYLYERGRVPRKGAPRPAAGGGWAPPVPYTSQAPPKSAPNARRCHACGQAVHQTFATCTRCGANLAAS